MLPVNQTYMLAPSYVPVPTQTLLPHAFALLPNAIYDSSSLNIPNTFYAATPLAFYPAENVVSLNSYQDAERKIDEKIKQQIEKYQSEELKKLEVEKEIDQIKAQITDSHHNQCCNNSRKNEYYEMIRSCQGCNCNCAFPKPSVTNCACQNVVHQNYDQNCCQQVAHTVHKNSCQEHSDEQLLLNIEDKIQRIRDELHLPPEQVDCNYSYSCCSENPKTKYRIEADTFDHNRNARSRSKSRSATLENRLKSKSPSGRPLWKPTGLNDYAWTKQTRNEILNGDYNPLNKSAPVSVKPDNNNSTKTTTTTNIITKSANNSKEESVFKLTEVKVETDSKNYYSVKKHEKVQHSSKPKTETADSKWRYTSSNNYTWANETMNQLRDGVYVVNQNTNQHRQAPISNVKKDPIQNKSSLFYNTLGDNHEPKMQVVPKQIEKPEYRKQPAYVMHAVEKTKKGSLYANQTGDCIHYIPDNADLNRLDVGSSVKLLNSNCIIIHE